MIFSGSAATEDASKSGHVPKRRTNEQPPIRLSDAAYISGYYMSSKPGRCCASTPSLSAPERSDASSTSTFANVCRFGLANYLLTIRLRDDSVDNTYVLRPSSHREVLISNAKANCENEVNPTSASNKNSLQKMFKTVILVIGVAFIVSQCSERNPPTATFNVYFWFPNNPDQQYLGEARGLDQCGAVASSYATSKSLGGNDGWSYICCLKTSESECAEKHR